MEYEIAGTSLPVAICTLRPGQAVCADVGAMGWMTPNVNMDFTNSKRGSLLRSNEFATFYCGEVGPGMVAFPISFAGAIMPFHLQQGEAIVCQRGNVLCIDTTITRTTFFQKRMGGGSGDYVLQRLTGPGVALIEIGGAAIEYQLAPGEGLRADPAHIVVMDFTVQMALRPIKGARASLFGNDGCIVELMGPGRVWMQSMPMPRMAGRMLPLLGS